MFDTKEYEKIKQESRGRHDQNKKSRRSAYFEKTPKIVQK